MARPGTDNDLVARAVKWGREHDVADGALAMAATMLSMPGGLDNLRGPAFDSFIEDERAREERRRELSFFHEEDHAFLTSLFDAIGSGNYESIIAVGTTRAFLEVIIGELERAIKFGTLERIRSDIYWYRPSGSVFKVELQLLTEQRARDGVRGRSVDKVILHDRVGWRAAQAIIPCERRST